MAKLNLSNTVSEQVAALFQKSLTSKSATSLIGLRVTIDTTSTLEVDIKRSSTQALLGWIEPGTGAKEIWPSWLTRRGISADTGEVFSNSFIIKDKAVKVSPQEILEIISSNDLMLENVDYHNVVEATFSNTGQRTGEEEVRRPFFTWRVLPRREVPPRKDWNQEILSRLSGEDRQTPEQEPEKAPEKSSKPRKTSKKVTTPEVATDDDTSDDVPF